MKRYVESAFVLGATIALVVTLAIAFLGQSPGLVAGASIAQTTSAFVPSEDPHAEDEPAAAQQVERPAHMTSAFSQALTRWQAPDVASVGAARGGQRETWLLACRSGQVSMAATHGWCYAPELKLFFNVQTKRLLDPRSGRVFALGAGRGTLIEEVSEETDEGPRPPTLRGSLASDLSLQCTPAQQAEIDKHVAGLEVDATRTDSPVMAGYFTGEAQWWRQYCHAAAP